jgi:hypothetical protein
MLSRRSCEILVGRALLVKQVERIAIGQYNYSMSESNDPSTYYREYYARNRERIRARYRENREYHLERQRERRPAYIRRLKRSVFDAYGNRCNCCGEDNPGFLSIDHVHGGGRKHRQAVGGGVMVLLEIIKAEFPNDYQLLCFNCNLGRNLNAGICPHESISTGLWEEQFTREGDAA